MATLQTLPTMAQSTHVSVDQLRPPRGCPLSCSCSCATQPILLAVGKGPACSRPPGACSKPHMWLCHRHALNSSWGSRMKAGKLPADAQDAGCGDAWDQLLHAVAVPQRSYILA